MSNQVKQNSVQEAVAALQVRTLSQPPRPGGKLKPERVQEELKKMPGWKLMPDGKAISRLREFGHPAGASKWASFVAELARWDHQPVHLGISGTRVLLTLPYRNGTSGLTAAVFDFARQLG
jgi:pterin-4a-carbinolamine dehydratase